MDAPAEVATISREETGAKGRYVARISGLPDAELTFSRANAKLIILDHTDVPDALKGRGVGLALVERAVEEARASGTKIIPLCPFARAQFARHGEWADVLSA